MVFYFEMETPAVVNLIDGALLDLGDLKVRGVSLSGVRTSLAIPSLDLAFDVAQGYPYLFPLDHFFITHAHLDHSAGIPYLISQKNMYRHKPPKFYMPASMIDGLREIMSVWEKLEDHTYRYEFIPVGENFEQVIRPGYIIRTFPTSHRVESHGYTLFRTHKKLRSDLQGLSQDELRVLRQKGENIQEITEEPWMTFTGDTRIEFLEARPWIRRSKYLFLESTYMDHAKSVAHAREWGHTHFDEILPKLDEIESEKIILIHVSSRYRDWQIEEILRKRCPSAHRTRVMLFPGR